MTKSISEWNEIIENGKITSKEMINLLKDYFSARGEGCEIENLIDIRDFIKSSEGKALIAKAFGCKIDEIACESVSIVDMEGLNKYKVILGSLSIDGQSASDTGNVKFVGGAVYFGLINPTEINIKYICGDVYFGNDYVNINEIDHIGGNIYAKDNKLQQECTAKFGVNFEEDELV